jgi:hypothetical protein
MTSKETIKALIKNIKEVKKMYKDAYIDEKLDPIFDYLYCWDYNISLSKDEKYLEIVDLRDLTKDQLINVIHKKNREIEVWESELYGKGKDNALLTEKHRIGN